MQKTTLSLEFVTPCFLGGASSPEPPPWIYSEGRRSEQPITWQAKPIRGQLRWWFRALAGGTLNGHQESVTRAEQAIFGSTDRASALKFRALGSPESSCDTQAFDQALSAEAIAHRWAPGDPSIAERLRLRNSSQTKVIWYLAYGLVFLRDKSADNQAPHREKYWDRRHFKDGELCSLQVRSHDLSLSPPEATALHWTFWCWLNLGGLGGRCRRGFGSMRVQNPSGSVPHLLRPPQSNDGHQVLLSPTSVADFDASARAVLATGFAAPVGRWTHFSSAARIYRGNTPRDSWTDAMVDLGCWLIGFRRRYGLDNDPRISGGRSVANRDYQWVNGRNSTKVPDRAGFGMPLGFSHPRNWSASWNQNGNQNQSEVNRRASPLLMHVAKLRPSQKSEFKYFPVLTHLPADLIPPGAWLWSNLQDEKKKSPRVGVQAEHKTIVQEFLDDLDRKNLVQQL